MPSFMKVPAHKIGVVPDVSPTGLPQTKFSDFKEDMDRDGSDSITVDEVKMRLEYIQELDAAVSVKFFSDVHKVDSHFTPIEILKFQRNVDDFTKVRCPWRRKSRRAAGYFDIWIVKRPVARRNNSIGETTTRTAS